MDAAEAAIAHADDVIARPSGSHHLLHQRVDVGRDARAGSVICAYNGVNGVPSCANPYLLQDILRDHFGMGDDGWVISDCDAVLFVWYPQGYTSTMVNGTAMALKAGTDLDCPVAYLEGLGPALNQTLISEDNIKTALTRLYTSLVK